MSRFDHRGSRRLALFETQAHECPYVPSRIARTAFIDPRASLDTSLYAELIQQGFRRSGRHLYRPSCQGCNACCSLRIPVAKFRPRRRHRRCLRRNASISVASVPPRFCNEHFSLYRSYVAERHPGSSMDDPTPESYQSFLGQSWCDTEFLELYENDRLLAVAVMDDLGNALSAVYTFYEPGLPDRSLGTLAILCEIAETRRRGYDYLYLGYWITGCAGMDYKAEFRPHEVLTSSGWMWVE